VLNDESAALQFDYGAANLEITELLELEERRSASEPMAKPQRTAKTEERKRAAGNWPRLAPTTTTKARNYLENFTKLEILDR